MPTFYMLGWSLIMTGGISLIHLRDWRKTVIVAGIALFVLLFSQTLFVQLAVSAGIDPSTVLYAPADFLASGIFGWLALMIMPCGWFGPILGLKIVQRWQRQQHAG